MTLRALVRPPSGRLADGLVTHVERQPIDLDLAREQWQSYVDALTSTGWQTVEVPLAEECPDSVFVEDSAVMYGDTAVIVRPGAAQRRGEPAGTGETLRRLGYSVAEMGAGTLDGGDVLKIGNLVYVGRGGRTDATGVAEFRRLLAPLGARVVAVPLTKVLHLKSAVTALPDGTVIGYPPLVDDPAFFPHFRAMPEEGGAHVVDLGGGRVLMANSAPRSAELIGDLGFEVVTVDISEYEKLEGCVTCLSIRLRTPVPVGG